MAEKRRAAPQERIIFPAAHLVEAFSGHNKKKIKSFFLKFFGI
jgi:hypothetical protein